MSPAKISQSRIIQNRIYRLWNLATGIDIQPELFCSKAPPGPLKEERGRGKRGRGREREGESGGGRERETDRGREERVGEREEGKREREREREGHVIPVEFVSPGILVDLVHRAEDMYFQPYDRFSRNEVAGRLSRPQYRSSRSVTAPFPSGLVLSQNF